MKQSKFKSSKINRRNPIAKLIRLPKYRTTLIPAEKTNHKRKKVSVQDAAELLKSEGERDIKSEGECNIKKEGE